jgi:hypothetical protein
VIVTHQHAKELKYCNAGLRRWFDGRDLTFDEFRKHGASVEWLLAQDDAMATRLVEYVKGKT